MSDLETKRAMFWAALVAQCAGEPSLSSHRIAGALLRTPSVEALCAREKVDVMRLRESLDDGARMSFDECRSRVEQPLSKEGLEFGSAMHQSRVELRPVDPALRLFLGSVIERYGHLAIEPVPLLAAVLNADPEIAGRFARAGLTAEAVVAAADQGAGAGWSPDSPGSSRS